jgi:hypothetical protein
MAGFGTHVFNLSLQFAACGSADASESGTAPYTFFKDLFT